MWQSLPTERGNNCRKKQEKGLECQMNDVEKERDTDKTMTNIGLGFKLKTAAAAPLAE